MLNKIIKLFRVIPNIPFLIIIFFYVLINVIRHTPAIELEFVSQESFYDIKKHIDKFYPKHFRNFIAILFWSVFFIHITIH